MLISALKEIEIFKGLNDEELSLIAQLGTEEEFKGNEVVFEEGDPARRLFLVLEGKMNIVKWNNDRSKQIIVDTISSGKILGWSALTEPSILSASALTTGPNRLIAFEREALINLFEDNNKIGYIVMKNLTQSISQRLRHTSEHLLQYSKNQFSPKGIGESQPNDSPPEKEGKGISNTNN